MAPRKRSASPVQIVLSEEEIAAIIRQTVEGMSAGKGGAGTEPGTAPPAPEKASALAADPGPATAPLPPLPPTPDRAWSLGVRSPGAVGDAIRMILDATSLGRGKRMRGPLD